ncbi:IMP dehydrogenase, partial [Bacillus toyonensis]|uniref:IMP dehydrogenase n=1 Tax=Bacillus toyonensis TaxID=155322 RepID=UPI003D238A2D
DKITVANNKKTTDDKITVTGLKAGDKVNVYSAATGGTAIGTVTVADGKTEATVTKTDGLVAAGGTVYVSIQSKDELESARTAAKYGSEVSVAPVANNIVVLNNEGDDDIVKVTGLAAGDVVNVYNVATGGAAIGTATVADGKTSTVVKVKLGVTAGKVHVTVTKGDKEESTRVAKDYIAE